VYVGQSCANDAYCDKTSHCAQKGGAGATCATNDSQTCASPYVCVTKDLDAGTGLCGTPNAAGSPCLDMGQNQCLIPDECINGVCTAVGLSGQPCASSGGFCYDGACAGRNPDAGTRGTCGAYQSAGGSCTESFECESVNCDPTANVCIAACQ
jgi:hypothetical protein